MKTNTICQPSPSSINYTPGHRRGMLRKAFAALGRIAKKIRRAFPETYPWMPPEEAKKVIPDPENFAVFSGRLVRVRERPACGAKSDGDISA